MQKFHLQQTPIIPEIYLSPEENIFIIRGTSAPEDVRSIYYPVIEWMREFTDELINENSKKYTTEDPLRFRIDLAYFNSSSAKFLYDILLELKKLSTSEIPAIVEWCYEAEDVDMIEAGEDIAELAEMNFTYIPKSS
jgi:hypothetical protein